MPFSVSGSQLLRVLLLVSSARVPARVRRHPRVVAGTLATLFLGVVSTAMLVGDVGVAFARTVPVMSGLQLFDDVQTTSTIPGVRLRLFFLDIAS